MSKRKFCNYTKTRFAEERWLIPEGKAAILEVLTKEKSLLGILAAKLCVSREYVRTVLIWKRFRPFYSRKMEIKWLDAAGLNPDDLKYSAKQEVEDMLRISGMTYKQAVEAFVQHHPEHAAMRHAGIAKFYDEGASKFQQRRAEAFKEFMVMRIKEGT